MTWVYQILTLNEYNCLLPTAYCLLPGQFQVLLQAAVLAGPPDELIHKIVVHGQADQETVEQFLGGHAAEQMLGAGHH